MMQAHTFSKLQVAREQAHQSTPRQNCDYPHLITRKQGFWTEIALVSVSFTSIGRSYGPWSRKWWAHNLMIHRSCLCKRIYLALTFLVYLPSTDSKSPLDRLCAHEQNHWFWRCLLFVNKFTKIIFSPLVGGTIHSGKISSYLLLIYMIVAHYRYDISNVRHPSRNCLQP